MEQVCEALYVLHERNSEKPVVLFYEASAVTVRNRSIRLAGRRQECWFVAQGSIVFPPEPILLPFIRALGDGSDVLPVLLIGQRGGKLSSGFQGPENTRGFDYFPRDHILHSADLFIFNAGYGGAGHVIGDGGPIAMVGHSWGRQKSLHE
ncbi:hypothetical protein TruAng_008584 [Truncatella angustata]|nr:hypothetical protein TruAng_008584 [Truncatella angustata]